MDWVEYPRPEFLPCFYPCQKQELLLALMDSCRVQGDSHPGRVCRDFWAAGWWHEREKEILLQILNKKGGTAGKRGIYFKLSIKKALPRFGSSFSWLEPPLWAEPKWFIQARNVGIHPSPILCLFRAHIQIFGLFLLKSWDPGSCIHSQPSSEMFFGVDTLCFHPGWGWCIIPLISSFYHYLWGKRGVFGASNCLELEAEVGSWKTKFTFWLKCGDPSAGTFGVLKPQGFI